MWAGAGQHLPTRPGPANVADAEKNPESTSRDFVFKATKNCICSGKDVPFVRYVPNGEASAALHESLYLCALIMQ